MSFLFCFVLFLLFFVLFYSLFNLVPKQHESNLLFIYCTNLGNGVPKKFRSILQDEASDNFHIMK